MSLDPQKKPAKTLTYREKLQAGIVKPKPRSAGMTSKAVQDMKRTPLKRSTKKIRQVSRQLGKTLDLYRTWIAIAMVGVHRCDRCKKPCLALEPHHPFGRKGEFIFCVTPLCSSCHKWIHEERPNQAFQEGWLQPEYRGTVRPDNFPEPFTLLPERPK